MAGGLAAKANVRNGSKAAISNGAAGRGCERTLANRPSEPSEGALRPVEGQQPHQTTRRASMPRWPVPWALQSPYPRAFGKLTSLSLRETRRGTSCGAPRFPPCCWQQARSLFWCFIGSGKRVPRK